MAADPSLRDRALAAIDDAVLAIIGKETEAAWAKRTGGQPEGSAVKQFADGLPRLFALRAQLRSVLAAAMPVPPTGALS